MDEASSGIFATISTKKWGWVIYRTAYGDDAAWERFKQFVVDNSAKYIAESSVPGITRNLEWTFVSDQEALDGASTAQLRARFRSWAAEAIRTENPRATEDSLSPHWRIQRYSYFIEWQLVWVKFVRADWESDPDEDDGSYELINGTTEEDVGWMLVMSDTIRADFYDGMGMMGWVGAFTTLARQTPAVPDMLIM
ncbi:hypothetical protein SCUP234_02055 [Seiridium cupressi]